MASGRRQWLGRAALGLGATVGALILAELTLSLLSVGDPVLRDVDPVLGWAPIAGAEGVWTREGRAHVRISEHGFRGVDVAPGPPPPGTRRVAIVGDSYTEAMQVALEERFGAHVEGALTRCAGPTEVLSFGVSGYGTAQEYRLLRHRVRAWQPDVVLVAFLTGNDVADNHPELRASGDPAPYFRLRRGRLELDNSFLRSEGYRARARGSAYRWLRRRSRLLRLLSGLGRARGAARRAELGLTPEVYAPPATDAWREAWAVTEALLARMSVEERQRGARFGVVTLTNAAQVDPDPEARARLARELSVDDLRYPDRRVAAAGARDGYPVLSLVEPLGAWALAHGEHLHGFENTQLGRGHWNATGHRVAGAAIGAWLCEQLAE